MTTVPIDVASIFPIGNRFGVRLDDGVEIVGDGSGMDYVECERWLDRIEEHNKSRPASRPASAKRQAVGGTP